MSAINITKICNLCEKKRQKALEQTRELTRLLSQQYDVKKVILFGSVTQKEKFSFHSDIDLAVEGLKDEYYWKAYGELLVNSSFKIDLVPIEKTDRKFKERLTKEGVIIYERD
ncbi:MAG: nucleotidyltransferase domain-containing protein [bacterium]|nr:nucleotidyltransferase domain-containing protein [bacterium]